MKNIISSAINMAEYFVSGVALSILYHGKFLWYRVNIIISRNILSMALNEEYCIHDVALLIWRNIFCQWRRTINIASQKISSINISRNISSMIISYVNIIISRNILSMALNEEYCIHGVALLIWRNISSVASHYQYASRKILSMAWY